MAFAVKASPSPSSSPAPLPRRRAATAGRPVAVRALAAVAPVRAAVGKCGLSVAQTLSRLREKGKTAFIPYVTAGDPDMATTAEALRLLDACGADVIELGMPFSDPCADGPVIQASAARALAGGATAGGVMSMLKEVTPELSCPVVLFSYFGPIIRRGAASFTAAAKEAGVHGLIVPDLPYVETCSFRNEAIKNNLELVLLTTPATPAERMKEITKSSEGFVYLVSVNGVTGPRANVNPRVKDLLQEIKQVTDKAVAVGFGISTPEHVRQVKRLLFKRGARRGPWPPVGHRIKHTFPTRGSKYERSLISKWPLRVCYRGVICHGAKWQRWKKANPGGSMKAFFRSRARSAAMGRKEIRAFWERRGKVFIVDEPSYAEGSEEASSSCTTPEDIATEREYASLVAKNASDEELLQWATRREEWDFAP